MPFSERQAAVHPLQFYAATKRANELMAHSYSHLFGLPTTGLRFFTVYGPWGRPDMALFLFTKNILAGRPIPVFNHGNHGRDFTFVEDIAEGVIRASDQIATGNPHWDAKAPDPASSYAPWRLFNIGNSSPVKLMDYIKAIETAAGKAAILDLLPLQAGDVPDTFATTEALNQAVGYQPTTPVAQGVAQFVAWYREYYGE
jgi:UDP-glucuronate 4-epimerase